MDLHERIAELESKLEAAVAECKVNKEITLRVISMLACSGYEAKENSLNPAEDLLFHAEAALDTPQTDAIINALRAEGVDMFACEMDDSIVLGEVADRLHFILAAERAKEFAAQLRNGEHVGEEGV